MCCFSGDVGHVSDTRIFARAGKNGRQFLVYSMQFQANKDLAMILPIPTPKGSAENAVRFINLEKYPEFFADVEKGYPRPQPASRGNYVPPGEARQLPVVNVGLFDASFVPTQKDFLRLDERFRLPADLWDKLPRYADFGFAVFKLKATGQAPRGVHPMALEFPRDDEELLFFPTVHIHHGTVPMMAEFDHTLYCQLAGDAPANWEESSEVAGQFMKVDQSQGIVDEKSHVYRKTLSGKFANKDVAVSV